MRGPSLTAATPIIAAPASAKSAPVTHGSALDPRANGTRRATPSTARSAPAPSVAPYMATSIGRGGSLLSWLPSERASMLSSSTPTNIPAGGSAGRM